MLETLRERIFGVMCINFEKITLIKQEGEKILGRGDSIINILKTDHLGNRHLARLKSSLN